MITVIKKEKITREDGVELIRTYSDENFKIRQVETGIVYDEAVDVKNSGYTYEETDEKIESEVKDGENKLES